MSDVQSRKFVYQELSQMQTGHQENKLMLENRTPGVLLFLAL